MKKLYLLGAAFLMLSSFALHAQRVTESFATSLTPTGWVLSNTATTPVLLTRSATVNGYGTATNVGSVRSNFYNVGNGNVATLQTPTFTGTGVGDSLRFDVAHASYPGYVDSLSVFAYDGVNYTMLSGWQSNTIVDNGITTANAQTGLFTPTAAQWRTKVLPLPLGTTAVLFRFRSGFSNDLYIDNVIVDSFYIAGMTYDSSTTIQTVTTAVAQGSKKQQIVSIRVNTTGNTPPLAITDFGLSTGSSTSPTTDIDSAKLYYTGSSNAFATNNLYGWYANPNGAFNISGNTNLVQGANYFWLVYDIKPGATPANIVDGECQSLIIGGIPYSPSVTSPAGQRTIVGSFSGTYTIGTSGNYPTLTAAISDLSVAGMQGNTRFEIISNVTEPGTVVIPQWTETGAGGYRLTIAPSTPDTIFANGANSGAIVLLNADRITIDGRIAGTGNNLTVVNTNTAANHAAMLIASAGTNQGCSNDTIRNLNIMAGNNTVTSIGIQAQGDNNNNLVIMDNVFKRSQTAVNVFTTNYPAGANTGLVISGNMIGDISNTMNVRIGGIGITNSPDALISRNTIYNVNEPFGGTDFGIQVGANSSRTRILGNKIDSVMNGNSGGWSAFGINITGSDSLTIANNSISRIVLMNYSTSGTTYNPFGIRITAGDGHRVVYNSVNMYGPSINTGTSGTLSAALVVTGGSNLVVRNNIFANSYLGLTGSSSYAIYVSATAPFSSINNNDYYATGTYGVLGYFAGSARTNLAAWKAATAQDVSSIASNPFFTGGSDLTINSGATGTELESGGAALAYVTTDYNGDTRPKTIPTTYGGNTAPDIGAFEFDGQPADFTPPVISYSTLANTSSLTNRVVNGFATITDAVSNVNVNSGTSPRFYFKKKADANVLGTYPADNNSSFNGWKYVEASNASSPFSFTIDYSLLTGAGVAVADTIQYFVVAQDLASIPNVSANPLTGFTGTTVNNVSSAPTTPNSYIITPAALSGTILVGALQTAPNYTTLTAAVNDLNLRGISAPVILELTDATYSASETFPIVINEIGGASAVNTVTIRPAAAVTSAITGSSGVAIIKFNGSDYVTIDGSNNGTSSKDLTITNTSVSSNGVVWIGNTNVPYNGATFNTVKNCNITGNTSTGTTCGVVISSGITSAAAAEISNGNNTISGNVITKALNGIFAIGSSSVPDSNWVFSNNTIGSASVVADKMALRGIAVQNAKNVTISNNVISGVITATTTTSAGILAGALVNGGVISGNKIMDVKNTNSGQWGSAGILLNTSNANTGLSVVNNFVSDVASVGYPNGWGAGDNGYGITVQAGGGFNIYFNTINMGTDQSGPANTAAINIVSGTTLNIRNNIFINAQTLGVRYAIYSSVANTAFTTINYNNYRSTGTAIGFLTTARNTLADWQTATTQDANSQTAVVNFVSATDLHLTGASIGNYTLKCPPVAGITTDIDGDTRNTISPWHYMGADENTGSPLPVVMGKFVAVKAGESAVLDWTTVTETNNSHFVVERSLDAINFEQIGKVNGAGNSKKVLAYTFKDVNAAIAAGAGTAYYRLIQVDFNGKETVSEMVSVDFGSGKVTVVSGYPNPVITNVTLNIQSNEAGNIVLNMVDLSGRQVYAATLNVNKGANTHQLDMSNLGGGVYFLTATLNGQVTHYKIIKAEK